MLSGWSGRRSGTERGMSGAILALVGEGRGHGEFDAAHADAHKGADLQQLEADGTARGADELSVGEADAAQGTQQHIGHRGKPGVTP